MPPEGRNEKLRLMEEGQLLDPDRVLLVSEEETNEVMVNFENGYQGWNATGFRILNLVEGWCVYIYIATLRSCLLPFL